MPYPGRNTIYEATIKRMVIEALKAQEQEFARKWGSASDEQLLIYLRSCAQHLGHTPWPKEIVGGSMIELRFGAWENALAKASLPKPTTQDKLIRFARYLEETERQKTLYREKKGCQKAACPAKTERKTIRVTPLARKTKKSCLIALGQLFRRNTAPTPGAVLKRQ